MHCLLAAPLLKECREVSTSFLSRILQTQLMFFVVRQSSLFWNHFSYFKDYVYSKSSLLKWNQRCSFENQAFFFFKDPTHVIQNTQFLDYHVFWKQKLTQCRIKMVYPMFVVLSILTLILGISLMVCDEVTFVWISKSRCSSQILGFIKRGCFFFSSYFISMHNNQ
jgi:sensor histidine kinase YesM